MGEKFRVKIEKWQDMYGYHLGYTFDDGETGVASYETENERLDAEARLKEITDPVEKDNTGKINFNI